MCVVFVGCGVRQHWFTILMLFIIFAVMDPESSFVGHFLTDVGDVVSLWEQAQTKIRERFTVKGKIDRAEFQSLFIDTGKGYSDRVRDPTLKLVYQCLETTFAASSFSNVRNLNSKSSAIAIAF